jgi:outer membrane protein TolC
LTLEEVRELALANNKELQLGRLNIEEKQIAISAATRDYFPKVIGFAYYAHFNDDLGTVFATRTHHFAGFTGPGGILTFPGFNIPGKTLTANVINQDTLIGGVMAVQPITKLIGVSVLVDLARADAAIAAAKLDKGTIELLSGVTQAYYGLLAAQQIKAALNLQMEALAPILKAHPTPALRLGELELRKGLVETEKQIGDLTTLLNKLLVLPPCTCLELAETPLPAVPFHCAEEAAQEAVVNNPRIREAEQDISKARAALRAAKMDCYPDVNLYGGYLGQTWADYIQPNAGVVGVMASYTFVDWGKRRQVKHQRELDITLAMQNVEVVADTVRQDARKAFLDLKEAEGDLQIAGEVVKARKDAEKQAQDMQNVLTTKSETAKAQLDLMKAEVTYRIAHAKLMAAINHP